MKLSVKQAGSQGLFAVIGDESDRTSTLEVFGLGMTQQAQVSPYLRGTTPGTFNRGNLGVQISTVITKTYASLAEALASVETLSGYFAGRWHLSIEQDSTKHYYPNAVLTSYAPTFVGLTVRHQLDWVTQKLQTTEP